MGTGGMEICFLEEEVWFAEGVLFLLCLLLCRQSSNLEP